MPEIVIDIDQYTTIEALEVRKAEVAADAQDLYNEFQGKSLEDDAEAKARWEALKAEDEAIKARIAELKRRDEEIRRFASDENRIESGDGAKPGRFDKPVQVVRGGPENMFDLTAYRQRSSSPEEERQLLRDGAMRAVEKLSIEDPFTTTERAQGHVSRLLDTVDAKHAYLSRRLLATGSPAYRRAFWKTAFDQQLSQEEQRALNTAQEVERAFSLGSTGLPVVWSLDPTIVPTSNFSVNPYRAIARVETITGTNEWRAATSGAITAAYGAEAAEATDNTPTLAQPDIIVEKAQAYVMFSIEVQQDWGAVDQEMRTLLQDAKDDLEATKFTTGAGHGSTEPKGIITAATTTVAAGGVAAFAIADLYKLFEGLPPRFRPRASFLGNLFVYDKIRQFDTAGGSGVWALDTVAHGQLQAGAGGEAAGAVTGRLGVLLSRNAYEATAMASVLTTGSLILAVGDFRYFVIVDRIGMNVEIVPLVVGTSHRPTGQRGMYCYWRNSSDVMSAAAFRVLVTS